MVAGDILTLIDNLIPKIILILVVVSEILLLHSAVDKSEKDLKKNIFYAFSSICIISISILLFTDAGGEYERLFRAGAALSGFVNMAILLILVKLLI